MQTQSSNIVLEVCAGSLPSALAAESGGADRIELCTALDLGGLTPSPGCLKAVKRALSIPVRVLIRPREGDFCYSPRERELLCEDIRAARDLGADGIVSGALLPDGSLDLRTIETMLQAAGPLPFTFHRAFDHCFEPLLALQQLQMLGVDSILSSGQATDAYSGRALLRRMVTTVVRSESGKPLTIMAGAGVSAQNVAALIRQTRVGAVHLSAKAWVSSSMQYRQTAAYMGGKASQRSEFDYMQTDEAEVRRCKDVIAGNG
jgi:Uncharacterized protein involved in copper resistance